MSRKTRFLSLLLASLMLLSAAACAQDGTGDDTSAAENTSAATDSTTEEVTTAPPTADLPDTTYDGYNFRVINQVRHPDLIPNYISVEDSSASVWAEAIHRRNSSVCDRFDITIESFVGQTKPDGIRTAIGADESPFDLYLPGSLTTLATIATEEMFLDYTQLPYVDLEMPWWDQKINESLLIAGKQYFAAGSLITMNNDATYVIKFNIDVGKNNGISPSDMYGYVFDGTWTLDRFYEICKKFGYDLNPDGVVAWDDAFGIAANNTTFDALFYSAGAEFVSIKEDGKIVLNEYNDKMDDVLNTISRLFTEDRIMLNGNAMTQPGFAAAQTNDNAISEGRVFMQGTVIEAMLRTRDAEANTGILPGPKYDENQEEYISMINPSGGATAAAVLITNPDPSRTSVILEALMEASHYQVLPVYYDTVLKFQALRDQESYEMLDYILESRRMGEWTHIFDWGKFFSQTRTAVNKGEGGFASLYASLKDQLNAEIAKLNG